MAVASPEVVAPVDLDLQGTGINLSTAFAHVAFLMPFLYRHGACMVAANLTESQVPSS